jgi:hypothetical protein
MTAGFALIERRLRTAATTARYLAPAGSRIASFERLVKGLLQPDYPLYTAVLAENAHYAFAAVLAGALLFRHREILVK